MSHFLFVLLTLIALAGCQVKEESGSGQLIAGHVPSTNSFTVSAPTSGVYTAGDVLSFTVSFPYNVDIAGGTPSLNLTFNSGAVNIPLSSGAGTKNLVFSYTVLGTDSDPNGIQLNSLALNGATMTFTASGVTSNCDISTVTSRNYSNILVDNAGPVLTGFSLVTPPGFYNVGEAITFAVTYDEPVFVGTPAPTLAVTFNAATTATYVSGSGTNTLNFQYTIASNHFDTNGYTFPGATITIPGGSYIRDASGNNAALNFSAYQANVSGTGAGLTCPGSTSDCVEFDGRAPYIVNITPPTPGNYAVSQNLDYVIEFNQNVTVASVSPLPNLALTIGSTTRRAYYSSGSGSRFLTFRYTTVPGDVDPDGITSPTSITLNTTEITATAGGAEFFITGTNGGAYSNNFFTAPDTSSVIITATQPQPTAVIRGADSTDRIFPTVAPDDIWIIDQPLIITVEFNTGMTVGQTGGTPYIPLTIGGVTRNATYLSGGDGQTSLTFRYVIQEGDQDADGIIQIGSIELNGGTITDSVNTNSLLTLPVASITSTVVDGIRPTINTVTPPANASYSTITVPGNFYFTINWSEAVNFNGAVNLPLTIGATPVNAATVITNNAAGIVVSPASIATLNDTDGITVISPLNGGTIRDQAGNTATVLTFPIPNTAAVLVDTTLPSVVSVNSPPAGTYNAGDDLEFVVTFDDVVNITNAGGFPSIQLNLTTGNVFATYVSGTGTNTITFSYEVTASDSHDGAIPNPTQIASTAPGYIRDVAMNSATTYAITTSMTDVIVDGLAPTISERTTTAGVYVPTAEGTNDAITITMTFSESITMTGGGTPWIELALATGNKIATYDDLASTDKKMVFRYYIKNDDMDLNGLTLNGTAIDPDGNTIKDANGNTANLNFGGVVTDLSNVHVAPHAIVWMRASLGSNRSAMTGAPGFSTTASYAANYYNFTGAETMSFAGLNGFSSRDVFMAIRTPLDTDTPVTQDLVDNFVRIDVPTGNLTVTGSGPASLAPNSLHQVQFTLLGVGIPDTMIPAEFTGRVAEILIFNSALTAGQQAHVNSFLSGTY